MTNCEKFQEFLPLWALGDLAGPEAFEFQQHLASCSSCQKEVEATRALVVGLKDLQPQDPGDLFFQRQLRQIQNQVSPAAIKIRSRRSFWLAPLLAAAAIVVLVLGISKIEQRHSIDQTTDWQTNFQSLAEENESGFTLEEIEDLNPLQLEVLANNLEMKILIDDDINWNENSSDWEDLNGPEQDTLIEHLQVNTSGRHT